MIVEKLDAYVESRRRISPQHVNRASSLGHDCLRYLVYCRTRWQDAVLPPLSLQYIFEGGKDEEDAAIRLIHAANIPIIEQQKDFFWQQYLISGHLDFKVNDGNGFFMPVEYKGLSPYAYDSINSIDDMIHHKRYYVRSYPSQLNIYMLMDNKERGLFLLRNKVSKRFKEIEMNLDYDLGERLLQKAEEINRHVAENTLPDQINNDEICSECAYNHICLPDLVTTEMQILSDPDLIEMLDERQNLMANVKRYNEIQESLKKRFSNIDKAVIGNWLLTGKMMTRKGYSIPELSYWSWNIKPISNN